jgi:hypothetical protein
LLCEREPKENQKIQRREKREKILVCEFPSLHKLRKPQKTKREVGKASHPQAEKNGAPASLSSP